MKRISKDFGEWVAVEMYSREFYCGLACICPGLLRREISGEYPEERLFGVVHVLPDKSHEPRLMEHLGKKVGYPGRGVSIWCSGSTPLKSGRYLSALLPVTPRPVSKRFLITMASC